MSNLETAVREDHKVIFGNDTVTLLLNVSDFIDVTPDRLIPFKGNEFLTVKGEHGFQDWSYTKTNHYPEVIENTYNVYKNIISITFTDDRNNPNRDDLADRVIDFACYFLIEIAKVVNKRRILGFINNYPTILDRRQFNAFLSNAFKNVKHEKSANVELSNTLFIDIYARLNEVLIIHEYRNSDKIRKETIVKLINIMFDEFEYGLTEAVMVHSISIKEVIKEEITYVSSK